MKIKKTTIGTMKVRRLKPLKKTICPSCESVGEFETDDNLETYCTHCGLIVESQYPYTAGVKYDLLQDILFKQNLKVRELEWKKRKKKY